MSESLKQLLEIISNNKTKSVALSSSILFYLMYRYYSDKQIKNEE